VGSEGIGLAQDKQISSSVGRYEALLGSANSERKNRPQHASRWSNLSKGVRAENWVSKGTYGQRRVSVIRAAS